MSACLAMPLPMTEAPRTQPAPSQDADAELVRRAVTGEMRAFEALYRRHAGRVHGAVWRLSGMNEARAEELTQEAFIRAWQADETGNLRFRRSQRNFNPLMAMAARVTIVEVEEPILPRGAIDPDDAHLPGIYVHRLVKVPAAPEGWWPQRPADVSRYEAEKAKTSPTATA